MQQMLGSMAGFSLDRSVLLDLGSAHEDEADADVVVSGVEVTELDEVTRLPRALTFDVLLFLSLSNAFSCRFFSFSATFLSLS